MNKINSSYIDSNLITRDQLEEENISWFQNIMEG